MPIRRQLVAVGLLVVACLAGPVWAAPAPSAAQAARTVQGAAPLAVIRRAFLPLLSKSGIYDVAVTRVEVIQAVTQGDSYTYHVAGRPALLRVFVSLTGGSSLPAVTARVQRYVSGVAQDALTAGPLTINAPTNEGNLSHTFNFSLPAGWLNPGSAYVVDLDYENAIGETDEANNRYPAAGSQPFNFNTHAPLDVVIVPVRYKGTTPPAGDLSYLTWMPIKVLPVSQINYSLRGVHDFTGDLTTGSGWSDLLNQISNIHFTESPSGDKLYFGLVDSVAADGCSGGCIAGIGYVSNPSFVNKTSLGFAGFPGSQSGRNEASPTFTHEMGHNFGRRHAPCGNPGNPDGGYPYTGASIGQWGYDNATGQLLSPASYKDYMSYCSPAWTSDYTYHGIAQAWSWLSSAAADAGSAAAAPTESLVVSGYYAPDGSLHVDPVFVADVAPAAPLPRSTHRLTLLDASGRVLAAVPFGLAEIVVEVPNAEVTTASFRVLAPPVTGLAGFRLYRGDEVIYERLAAGPAPALTVLAPASTAGDGAHVSWGLAASSPGAVYRVRFSPDGGATWHLLALDTHTPAAAVPAELLAGAAAPVLEVQASDGVRSDRLTLPLDTP